MSKEDNVVETNTSILINQLANEDYRASKHNIIPAIELYNAIGEFGKENNEVLFNQLYLYLRKKFNITSINRDNLKKFIRKYFFINGEIVNTSSSLPVQTNYNISGNENIHIQETFCIEVVEKIYSLINEYDLEILNQIYNKDYQYFIECLNTISKVNKRNDENNNITFEYKSLYKIIYNFLKQDNLSNIKVHDKFFEKWWKSKEELILSEVKKDKRYDQLVKLINKIPISNYRYNILFLAEESLREVFKSCEYKFVEDVINRFDFDFFHKSYEYYYNLYYLFDYLTNDLDEEILKKYNKLTYKLKDNEIKVLISRSKGNTLEFIGNELSLTRERVRQIELNALAKLKYRFSNEMDNKHNLLNLIKAKAENYYYIQNNEIKKILKNDEDLFSFVLSKLYIDDFVYIKELDCVDGSNTNWYKKSIEYFKSLPSIIKTDEINQYLLDFSNTILINLGEPFLLNKLKKAFYIIYYDYGDLASSDKLTVVDKYSYILSNYFKDGIHIYDHKEIEKFKYLYTKSFNDEFIFKSNRSFEGVFARFTYLVGRGKYNLIEKVPSINLKLLRQIIVYIKSTGGSSLYSAIFYYFEDDLIELNILNRYSLQGALKKALGKSYYYYKDYISLQKHVHYRDEIILYINSVEGIIDAKDLEKQFPHINESIIYNILLSTKELISIFNKKWIHIKNFEINEDDIDYFHNYLTDKVEANGVIVSQVIYDNFVVNYANFLSRNKISSQYTMYSILQYLFSEDFSFKRPFISKQNFELKNRNEYVLDFIYDNDILYFYELRDFCFENSIQINNISELLISINKDYLRIDKDRISRINLIGLDEPKLMQFIYTINNMLLLRKSFNLNKFKKYYLFPKLNFEWNVYLLASIIDKYVKSCKIINTTSNYTNTEYIIIAKSLNINTYEEYLDYKRG